MLEPTVGEQEALDFATAWKAGDDGATTPPCCSISTFRFDILGFPKSPWNLSAARVFCQSFIPQAERDPETIKAITSAFLSRVKALKQDYKAAQGTSAARTKNARIDRRNARKYLVCKILLKVVYLLTPPCFKVISTTTQHSKTHSSLTRHASRYA